MLGLFILLAIFALTPVVIYFIYDFLKVLYSRNRLFFVIVLIAMIVAPYSWYKNYEQTFYLNHIPREMAVTNILYQKTESWGVFGPGANETGIIVFELPESSAKTIKNTGIDYFSILSLEDTPRNEYIRQCGEWSETPMKNDSNSSWILGNFLDQYGFGIAVDSNIEKKVNLAVSKSGSYFTNCRGSTILIVIPEINKVVMVYAG
ncbi:MAG: hypothetical protein PHI47_10170 [Sulfuricurvum sp.]|uniref:hypothetical protein n=1 Tax=Sulfuricurvum sp. TaxID=2025608 RepID=UPI002627F15B|nr:hypothetical protein [Sulfuricurvum sp.]MDD5160406.1 hypothetical protein [Sulfuricurvum sp.]